MCHLIKELHIHLAYIRGKLNCSLTYCSFSTLSRYIHREHILISLSVINWKFLFVKLKQEGLLNKGHGGRTPPFGGKTNRNPLFNRCSWHNCILITPMQRCLSPFDSVWSNRKKKKTVKGKLGNYPELQPKFPQRYQNMLGPCHIQLPIHQTPTLFCKYFVDKCVHIWGNRNWGGHLPLNKIPECFYKFRVNRKLYIHLIQCFFIVTTFLIFCHICITW